jgi:hypothetical protein
MVFLCTWCNFSSSKSNSTVGISFIDSMKYGAHKLDSSYAYIYQVQEPYQAREGN